MTHLIKLFIVLHWGQFKKKPVSGLHQPQLSFSHMNFLPTVAAASLCSSHITWFCFHWPYSLFSCFSSKRGSMIIQASLLPHLLGFQHFWNCLFLCPGDVVLKMWPAPLKAFSQDLTNSFPEQSEVCSRHVHSWSFYFSFCHQRLQTRPLCVHCGQGCHQPPLGWWAPLLPSNTSRRALFLVGAFSTCTMQLPSRCFRNLRNCKK